MESKKIYIAGPEVFCPNASQILEEKKKLCLQYGYIGLTPYDTETSKKENNIEKQRNKIKQENEELISKSDIVIANLNSFRGFEADSGTCFEVGFASALKKKIYIYLEDYNKNIQERYAKYYNLKNISFKDLDGNNIENYYFPINIMFSDAIIKKSFEECLIDIKNNHS